MIREEGVPKLRGELRSISDVGTWVGGEEKRGTPGELAMRRRLGGGEMTSLADCGGEVTSEVWRTPVAAGREGESQRVLVYGRYSKRLVLYMTLTRSASPSLSRTIIHTACSSRAENWSRAVELENYM